MAQPGGSATINGILYQILGSIHWASSLHLISNMKGEELVEARLTIEPAGGGGDIQAQLPAKRVVEQWKAKSDHGTWSLQQIVEDVIPDLYLAIDENKLDDNVAYKFVTEGRRGRWQEAQDFFQELSRQPIPSDPLGSLDNQTKVHFFPNQSCTKCQLFSHIAEIVRQRQSVREESQQQTYKKLWHLLGHFEVEELRTKECLSEQINASLYGIVEYREDVDAKRRELCGIILELAAKGEVNLAPSELLAKAGLSTESFRNLSTLKGILSETLKQSLQRKKYSPDEDVRQAPDWPEEKHVLVLSGESGQGKTWQLAKLALTLSETGELTVFVTGEFGVLEALSTAANIVWKKGLNNDNSLSLDRVAQRFRDIVPTRPNPWLTLCIDDVQSISEARRLLMDHDWREWGIRLAITVPDSVEEPLKSQHPDEADFLEVKDFTAKELREYFDRRDCEWAVVEADIRDTLHRPLLANLYCELAEGSGPPLTAEYELYERYWQRISIARNQEGSPQDRGKVLRLVGLILKEDAVYPWTYTDLQDAQLNDDTQKRLEAIGWLRRIEDSQVEIWHDRLLNWAVAECLVEKWRSKEINTQELGNWLIKFSTGRETFAGKSLYYVPMDVLWLACGPQQDLQKEVPILLATLEDARRLAGLYPDSLYKKLLPTLGERIVPALTERARGATDQEAGIRLSLIADALGRIGDQYPEAVQERAIGFLNDRSSEIQQVGLKVLARIPCIAPLDRLWELHKQNVQTRESKDDTEHQVSRFYAYNITFSALRVCVRLQPGWLINKVHEADPQDDPVSELAYLLANLKDSSAAKLWKEAKSVLFVKVAQDRPRSLINCIRRFRDASEIPRLEKWLHEKNDLAASSALAALVLFAPDRAIALLDRVPINELYMTRNWWLPELLSRRRTEIQERLFAWMKVAEEDLWGITHCYQGQENEMDGATVDLLLEKFEERLRETKKGISQADSDKPRIHGMIDLLSCISRLELLKRFQAKAGSELEALLTSFACSRVGRMKGYFDHELHQARLILLKIGGSGLTRLVNCELEHEEKDSRQIGMQWASFNSDSETIKLLRALAESAEVEGDDFPIEQFLATRALASLQEDEAVVEAILRWGLQTPADLPDLLGGLPPMGDQIINKALVTLGDGDSQSPPGSLLALGLSHRKEFIPQIQQIFEAASPESDVALAAMLALDWLGDKDSKTVALIAKQLEVTDRERKAINALIRIGTEEALKAVETYALINNGLQDWRVQLEVAGVLARHKTTRSTALETIWQEVKKIPPSLSRGTNLPPSLLPVGCFGVIGDLENEEVREWLRQAALLSPESIKEVPIMTSIIRGLAKFDPEGAFQAASVVLKRANREKFSIPALLVELNQEEAIPLLCSHMPTENRVLTRWAIGRALRSLDYPALVMKNLREMLYSSDPTLRQSGAELCGWQGPGYLQDSLFSLVEYDIDDDVHQAALEAIQKQKLEDEILQLMSEFQEASDQPRWSLLEAILDLGDPYLLEKNNDALWLGEILKALPFVFTKHAEERLEKRHKELTEDAKKIDQGRKK